MTSQLENCCERFDRHTMHPEGSSGQSPPLHHEHDHYRDWYCLMVFTWDNLSPLKGQSSSSPGSKQQEKQWA